MVRKAVLQGKGSLLAKIDIKTAYRLVPVSPYQRHYLGKSWKNQTYADRLGSYQLQKSSMELLMPWNGALVNEEYNTYV